MCRARSSLRLGERFDDGVVERVGALRRAGDVIRFRTLAGHHLRWQRRDPRTRIARQALRDRRGDDAAGFDDNGGLDVAVTAGPPPRVAAGAGVTAGCGDAFVVAATDVGAALGEGADTPAASGKGAAFVVVGGGTE